MDIDKEFQELMQDALDKIKGREERGAYDRWDAAELVEMVQKAMSQADTSRYGERCPEGHDDPDNCGWSPSMGYHC